MNPIAAIFLLAGVALTVLAAIGLLRFSSPYARFHSSGKASPISFVLIAAGAAIELGGEPAARLGIAVGAMVLTLPVGVHTLFRATHRSSTRSLPVDDLYGAEEEGAEPSALEEADGPPA